MGFWPFGKKDDGESEPGVEYASRVITGVIADGSTVRGKLVIHFKEPVTARDSDRALQTAAAGFEREMASAGAITDLASADLASRILGQLPDNVVHPRSLEVVALHVVDDAPPSSALATPLPQVAPPSRSTPSSIPPEPSAKPLSVPPSQLDPATPKVGSTPPPKASEPPPAPTGRRTLESEPVSVAIPPSRKPSGQMLSARGERLVPPGASPESAGQSLGPLMRDVSTKLTIGILRAYDLLVIRQVPIEEGDSAMAEAIVPVSAAPLGQFGESRAEELGRWEKTLGDEGYAVLSSEAAIMVAYLFYEALRHVQLDQGAVTTVVESMSAAAFSDGKSAIAGLGRYFHRTGGNAATELTTGITRAVGHERELKPLETILTPLLASLQDDVAIAAAQVRAAIPRG